MNNPPESQPEFARQIAIQGVGLIGGSIAAALKKNNFSGSIIGIGRNLERLQKAIDSGLIDQAETDLKQAATSADLIIICTPVDMIIQDVMEAASTAQPGTLITDGGSVKGKICHELKDRLPEGVTFIGSHPLAGSEKRGFEHADPDLYQNRVCVVTPEENAPADQLDRNALASVDGWVMVLRSAAFNGHPATLNPDPRLHLIGLFTEEATNWTGGTIETESAKPFSAPQTVTAGDTPRRVGSAILALVALLVFGGILWLIL